MALFELKTDVKIAHRGVGRGADAVLLGREGKVEFVRLHPRGHPVDRVERDAVVHVSDLRADLFVFGEARPRVAEAFADLQKGGISELSRLQKVLVVDMEFFSVESLFHTDIITAHAPKSKRCAQFCFRL